MHEAGLKWANGGSYMRQTEWDVYKGETCYNPARREYANKKWWTRIHYTIHPSELFTSEAEPVSDEITEQGLMKRGFESYDRHFRKGSIYIHFEGLLPVVTLVSGKKDIDTEAKNLTDIDHLIRLLGV